MIKVTLLILSLVCLGYVGLCLFLYLLQRSVLYYPHPPSRSIEAEAFWLGNDNHKLKIWQVNKEDAPALIYFGGNAEDVAFNLEGFKRLFPNYSLYLMNYRGYGGSSGSPSETGLFSDSIALYDYVAKNHRHIVVMGRSLGTGMAVYLAAEKPVKAVILITPYASMVDLAKHHYPYVPVNGLLKDRFESKLWAPQIKDPVLNLIAEYDEVISRKISDGLVKSFSPGIAKTVVIKGTSHNTIDSSPDYNLSLKTFLNNLEKAGF